MPTSDHENDGGKPTTIGGFDTKKLLADLREARYSLKGLQHALNNAAGLCSTASRLIIQGTGPLNRLEADVAHYKRRHASAVVEARRQKRRADHLEATLVAVLTQLRGVTDDGQARSE